MNANDPAFPILIPERRTSDGALFWPSELRHSGLTIRQHMATEFTKGYISNPAISTMSAAAGLRADQTQDLIVNNAVQLADRLIRRLNNVKEP